MPAKAVIQHRRDTEANWAGKILASGEIGYVTTGSNAGNLKIGDGSTAWGALPFVRTAAETVTAKTNGGLLKEGTEFSAVFGTTNTTVLRGDHAGLTTGVHGVTGAIVGTTDNQTLSNKSFVNFIERINVVGTAVPSTADINTETAAIWYFTSNATTNYTLNFRSSGSATLNSTLSNGQSITVTVMHTNGATAYYPLAFQIDGVPVTPRWQVGAAPTAGDINAINSYSFTILKTATTPTPVYTVFASQSRFD